MTPASDPVAPSHPSPLRGRVTPFLLLAPMAGGVFAWIVQLVASYGLAGAVCSAARRAAATPVAVAHETPILIGTNLLCLALALGAALISWSHWRGTRAETPGDVHAALSIGEGRSRFIASAGVMSSLGFALAILFNTVESLMVGACWTGVQ